MILLGRFVIKGTFARPFGFGIRLTRIPAPGKPYRGWGFFIGAWFDYGFEKRIPDTKLAMGLIIRTPRDEEGQYPIIRLYKSFLLKEGSNATGTEKN